MFVGRLKLHPSVNSYGDIVLEVQLVKHLRFKFYQATNVETDGFVQCTRIDWSGEMWYTTLAMEEV